MKALLAALLSIGVMVMFTATGSADPPLPVAHRGLAKHAPENTLAAFASCLELRLGFELDVRRSQDGELICLHDETLPRTTNGAGPAISHTLADLKKLDAGQWFNAAFTGERVPTLREVCQRARAQRGGPTLICLDLKAEDENLPADVAKVVREAGLIDRVVCIGTAIENSTVRKKLKAAEAKLPVAVLAQKSENLAAALADPHSDWAYLRFVPTAEQVGLARKAGKRVIAVGPLFMGQEVENWRAAATAGVDAILTDFPLECRAALKPSTK